MADKLPPPIDAGDPDFELQLNIMREVMARRSEALRQLAIADAIMHRDRDLLAQLAKR